jgi:hypothetical protein
MYEERTPVVWNWILAAAAVGLAATAGWMLLREGSAVVIAVIGSTALVLALTAVMFSGYFVRFDGETLSFGFRGLHKSLPLSAIEHAESVRISPWKTGGWGWRVCGLRHIAYVRAGGPGVRITTAARIYSFSCADPERLVRQLND